MNIFRHSHCPLCGSKDISLSGEITYDKPVLFSTHEVSIGLKPEFWKCRVCKSGFIQNILPEHDASKLYSDGFSGERWSQKSFVEEKTRKVVNKLHSIFGKECKVLDVGCNTGSLLDFAKSKGCKTAGVEFSQKSREILSKKGHVAFSSIAEVNETYSIITAFDLVEHLYSPQVFLNFCKSKLVDRGSLVILTGDIMSISALLTKSDWWYYRFPEHIVFPSRKYFEKFSGFKVADWVHTYAAIGYETPPGILCRNVVGSLLKRNYRGLPSLGPDHVLIVLEKSERL